MISVVRKNQDNSAEKYHNSASIAFSVTELGKFSAINT